MQDRISGCSSGKEMLMRLLGESGDGDCACARQQAAAKKGDNAEGCFVGGEEASLGADGDGYN